MSTTIEKRVRIVADCDPSSPREWDNVGTMVCWHRRYNLGDVQPSEDAGDYLQSLAIEACPRLGELIDYWENDGYEMLRDKYGNHSDATAAYAGHVRNLVQWALDKFYVVLPLYLYDHSGITMSTGPFSCPWDSGQVGFIYCTKAHGISECGSVENAEKCLRQEVETYDQYLTGDVYGVIVESRYASEDEYDDEWEQVDSCWGFFGSDPFENGMIEHVPEELREQLRTAEIEYP